MSETTNGGLSISDSLNLFAHNKWDKVRTEAENAWLEGCDVDANPYDRKTHQVEHYCWSSQWRLMNKYC